MNAFLTGGIPQVGTVLRRRRRAPFVALPHVADHNGLVHSARTLRTPTPRRFDAVVVLSIRSQPNLAHAASVAVRSGCPLIILCSHGLSPQAAIEAASRGTSRPHVFAVDSNQVAPDFGDLGLKLQTGAHHLAVEGRGDTSYKRNLALLLARQQQWRRLLFLDDDVFGIGSAQLEAMEQALEAPVPSGRIAAAAWTFESFADNSAVCHANRLSGQQQGVFLGGGGLALDVGRDLPFFPDVYNEDWLFLLPLVARGEVARMGSLFQVPYDPFDPHGGRAHGQEFGDTLAESLFGLMHAWAQSTTNATRDPFDWMLRRALESEWWDLAIQRRHEFLDRVLAGRRLPDRVADSVHVARRRLSSFDSLDFATWVRAWSDDLDRWTIALNHAVPTTAAPSIQHTLYWLGVDGVIERRGLMRRPNLRRTRPVLDARLIRAASS